MKTMEDQQQLDKFLAEASDEELSHALIEYKEMRNNLWTPGHITSYMRNRYELNDEYTRIISILENTLEIRKLS